MTDIQETERIDYIMPYLQDFVLDIEYMTINIPFIDIQARED